MKKVIKRFLRAICTFFAKKQCKSVGVGLLVNFPSRFTNTTVLGNHCSFNGIEVDGSGLGSLTIGDYFHSGKNIRIILDIHNYEGEKIPYDNTSIKKDVVIDDFVWLGTGVTILGGVHIGEGAIIQAGSTVVTDIPPYSIAGGHPARVFKTRDIAHFKRLKEQQAFH